MRIHNIETEQEIISRLLNDPELMKESYGQLSVEDFFDTKTKQIYSIFSKRYEEGRSWDLITLYNELKESENLKELLLRSPVSWGVHQFKEHLSDLKEKSLQREIYQTSSELQKESFEESPKELASKALETFSRIETRLRSSSWDIQELIEEHSKLMDDRITGKAIGISSGFSDLDYMLGNGFQRKDLIIIGARPSVGKTSFALTIGYNAATSGKQVLFITLEMDAKEVFDRLLSFETRIPVTTIIRGKIQREVLEKGYQTIKQLPFSLLHLPKATSGDVHAIAARHKHIHGLDLLIVDYLGYLSDRGDDEVAQLGRISKGLKTTANLLDCVVIAPHQLNRRFEKRSEGKKEVLLLSDLRDSGHIEQDADIVMFLNRDTIGRNPERTSLRIGKNRTGSTGILDVSFNVNTTKFEV